MSSPSITVSSWTPFRDHDGEYEYDGGCDGGCDEVFDVVEDDRIVDQDLGF